LHGVSIRPCRTKRSRSIRALVGALLVLLITAGTALATDHVHGDWTARAGVNSGGGDSAGRAPLDSTRGGGSERGRQRFAAATEPGGGETSRETAAGHAAILKAPQGPCAGGCSISAIPIGALAAPSVPAGSGPAGATTGTGVTPAPGAPALTPPVSVAPGVATGHRPRPAVTSLLATAPAPEAIPSAVAGIGVLATAAPATRGLLSALSTPATTIDVASTSAAISATGAHHAAVHRRATAPAAAAPQSDGGPSVIQRFVQVIPLAIWIALGASFALAMVGGLAALRSGRRARRQAEQIATVSVAALTDQLTGVLNRRGFTEATERELARARRYGRPFVLAYVDVRGLKAVNDTHGHLAGDTLIREAARLLRDSARADDVVGRIGGDELALLLAEQTAAGGAVVAARISAEVAARRPSVGLGSDWDLTIGLATFPEDGRTFEQLLSAADRRLYEQRGIALH
jgi:diguanylate cyclase (GGDEF)-like protein